MPSVSEFQPLDFSRIKALSVDLDETLWPILPTILRAEALTQDWIVTHAPKVAQRFDKAALRAVRDQLQREDPHRKVDLLKARRDTLCFAFSACGQPEAMALEALAVFVKARQEVTLFDDALPFLKAATAAGLPVIALSNGFADVHSMPIAAYFTSSVSAHLVGIAKPDKRIFDLTAQAVDLQNHEILHIGDDFELDIEGALAAGMQAYHVRRPESDLTVLTQLLQQLHSPQKRLL
jgi:FMN hydrolase / 5-amino-6-(5-phospho-D-ribitylamino)uracil phosphatase